MRKLASNKDLISTALSLIVASLYKIFIEPYIQTYLQNPSHKQLFLILISVFLLSYLLFWLFTKTRLWIKFRYLFDRFQEASIIFWKCLTTTQYKPFLYEVIERSEKHLEEEIDSNIKNSKKVYFLLLSAYTMFYDEKEKFIFKTFKNLSKADFAKKDIRILLLDKENNYFKARGKWFVNKMKKEILTYRVENYDEYKQRCEQIVKEIRTNITSKIHYYNPPPIWRIHLFDDVVYVSIYKWEVEGHTTSLLCFQRKAHEEIYSGFLQYFNHLYRHTKIIVR